MSRRNRRVQNEDRARNMLSTIFRNQDILPAPPPPPPQQTTPHTQSLANTLELVTQIDPADRWLYTMRKANKIVSIENPGEDNEAFGYTLTQKEKPTSREGSGLLQRRRLYEQEPPRRSRMSETTGFITNMLSRARIVPQ